MTIEAADGIVRLTGRCLAEDAEPLLGLLAAGINQVDLSGCEFLHGAVLQLLLAAQVPVTGQPAPFLDKWIMPLLLDPNSPPLTGS
jgi:hypothetical protein